MEANWERKYHQKGGGLFDVNHGPWESQLQVFRGKSPFKVGKRRKPTLKKGGVPILLRLSLEVGETTGLVWEVTFSTEGTVKRLKGPTCWWGG